MKSQAVPFPYVAFLLVAMSLLIVAYRDQQQDIAILKAQAALVPVHRQWVKKLEQRLESTEPVPAHIAAPSLHGPKA